MSSLTDAAVGVYAAEVARCFPDLPDGDRTEMAVDIADRLTASGATGHASAVAMHGPPQMYAAELREAMGLPAVPQPRRRPWIVGGAIALVVAIGAVSVVWLRGDDAASPVELAVVSGATQGAATTVGGEVVIDGRPSGDALVAMAVRNDGHEVVTISGVAPLPAVVAGMQTVSVIDPSDEYPSVWQPAARFFPQPDPGAVSIDQFDASSGFDMRPFDIEPGAVVVVQLRGPVEYCVGGEAGSGIGFPVRFDVMVDGRTERVGVQDIWMTLGPCP